MYQNSRSVICCLVIILLSTGCGRFSSQKRKEIVSGKMEGALMNVGLAAEKAHNYRYAADVFERAYQLNPKNKRIAEHLGHSYAASGQYRKSLTVYNKIRAYDAGNHRANLGVAENYLALQDYNSAIHAYDRMLSLTKGKAPRAYNGLGIILDRFGRYRLAKSCYRKGMEQGEKVTSLSNNYAMSLALSGHIDQALERIQATVLKQNTPRVKANHKLLKEVYVLATEKSLSTTACQQYLRERLFANERSMPKSLFKRMRRKAERVADQWCTDLPKKHAYRDRIMHTRHHSSRAYPTERRGEYNNPEGRRGAYYSRERDQYHRSDRGGMMEEQRYASPVRYRDHRRASYEKEYDREPSQQKRDEWFVRVGSYSKAKRVTGKPLDK